MFSSVPFQERASYAACHQCLALTEQAEVVRVVDFAATKYWGERVLEARDATGARYDRLESSLSPLADSDPRAVDFLRAEVAWLRRETTTLAVAAGDAEAQLLTAVLGSS